MTRPNLSFKPTPRRGLTKALGLMQSLRRPLLLLMLVTGVASAHQDQIVTIQPDGSLLGIPKEFGPVFLRVTGLDAAEPIVEFISGGHRNLLPACLTENIKTRSSKEISTSASWYHRKSILPYYVNVEFYDPGYDNRRAYNSSFNILFNLQTSTIIKIERFVAKETDDGGQYQDVVLPPGCTARWHEA